MPRGITERIFIMYSKELIVKERMEQLALERARFRAEQLSGATRILGADATDALTDIYSIFSESIYLWEAGLWDPVIGGFYYSESARDVEGFLPDIESTIQAWRSFDTAGLTAALDDPKAKATYDSMRIKMRDFALEMQDEDGFFYHKQWGKNIGVSRRGRDLGWAREAISGGGGVPRYPTPSDKKKDGESPSALLPEHLRSIKAFAEYLDEKDMKNNSYSVGNLLQAQAQQIKAAGEEFVDYLCDWYTRLQNPENGTWQDKVTYGATNGQMKVALAFSAYGREFPNAEIAAESAIESVLMKDFNASITSYYNPWITLSLIIGNLKQFGNAEAAESVRRKLIKKAPDMLRMTKKKLELFKKPDGGSSYNQRKGQATSQGAHVAVVGAYESDVNGNGLASTGAMRNVCGALGIEPIRFFTRNDGILFYELLENSYQAPKITEEEYRRTHVIIKD